MAQYPIPQFIETEGRIIAFLTFRQFFVLVGGGAICLLLYYVLPFFLFVICAIVIMLIAAVIAFLKINNESAPKAFLHFLKFSTETKNYTWKKKESSYPFKVKTTQKIESIQALPEIPTFHGHRSRLGDTKKAVDTRK